MAKSKNNLFGLVNQLSRGKSGQGGSKLGSPLASIAKAESGASTASVKLTRIVGTKAASLSAKAVATGLKFGSPSSSATSTSQTTGELSKFLSQTASGGISSALGGGLAGFLGIGSLVSGLVSLFGGGGGKSTPPPLVKFQLPVSQDQATYATPASGSSNQRDAGGSGATTVGSGGAHTGSGQANQPFQYQSAQIAQAVKQALLNSSSLSDVIAEI
jgi:hypothetical protein